MSIMFVAIIENFTEPHKSFVHDKKYVMTNPYVESQKYYSKRKKLFYLLLKI